MPISTSILNASDVDDTAERIDVYGGIRSGRGHARALSGVALPPVRRLPSRT